MKSQLIIGKYPVRKKSWCDFVKTTFACIKFEYVGIEIDGFGCRHLMLTINKVRTKQGDNRWH